MCEYKKSLREVIRKLGVSNGDIVYVASNITLFMHVARKQYGVQTDEDKEKFLNCFIDILKEFVTESGTLLFPTYTWTFCRDHFFDRRQTKSEVGALNNWILEERKDFVRTKHPIYSFMVWGKDKQYLTELDNEDSWGIGSPFEYLYHNKAKMLLLDVHLRQCFTFMHYVEECIKVPFRYFKNFRGRYVDTDGSETERSYTMFVRDLDIESDINEPDSMLIEPGVMKESVWNGIKLRLVDLAASYEIYSKDLLENGGLQCYRFKNYALDWKSPQTHVDDLNN